MLFAFWARSVAVSDSCPKNLQLALARGIRSSGSQRNRRECIDALVVLKLVLRSFARCSFQDGMPGNASLCVKVEKASLLTMTLRFGKISDGAIAIGDRSFEDFRLPAIVEANRHG